MDGKKTKRRRNVVNKRHGSMEEKPKSTEVMNEKEKQDRMEAASVLSSLMFLPPKSSKEGDITDSNPNNDQDTPSLLSSTNLGSLPSLPGIPPTLNVTPSLPKLGRPPKSAARNLTSEERNKLILADLENRLRQSFDSKSPISSSQSKHRNVVKANGENSSGLHTPTLLSSNLGLPVSLPSDKQVPLTVLPQTHTVNKNVLKALRNVMAKSSAGKNESDVNSNTETEHVSEKCSSPVMSTASNESEKMECDSTSGPLKKKESSDTNLPLKKRRLVGMMESSTGHSDSSSYMESVPSLGALNTSRQIENILQMEGEHIQTGGALSNSISSSISSQMSRPDEGYRPVQVDPRTSLMVLSDLKFALTPDEDGDLPLHIAVVHENAVVVRKFVDIMLMSGKTVDRFNKLQQTPLHLAILVNQPEIVETLLSAGANPNLLDRHGCTTIHSSVCKQFDVCMDTVFRTTKTQINLNCRDYEGYYPLHTCVELNNIKMLQQLIQQGADVNAQDGKAGRSVLLYAVEYNRCDIVQYLIATGGNAELQNYAGVTPLMVAQAGKMDEMVNILNKALDLVKVEEPQFIPKKMPISRVFCSSDTPESHHAMITNCVPLVYEEYDRVRRESNSEDIRPVFSRRSSTSSPIDLSMRGPSTQAQSQSTEYVVRGRPPRKKGKKENKGHREKHSMKSNLSEKHASIVAALEHKSKTEKSSKSKLDDILESERNNARSNFLKSFILNAYAKQLMSQAYRMQCKTDFSWKNPVNTSKGTEHESKKIDVQNIETIKSAEAKRLEALKIADVYSKQQSEDLNSTPEDNTVVSNELIDSKLDKIDNSNCIEMEERVELDVADKKDENEESMDVRNSPEMPVLSRATSECNDSNDNVLDEQYTSITSEPDSSTSPVLHDVQAKTVNTDHQNYETVERLEEDNSSHMNTEVEHLEPVNNHSSIDNNTCDSSDNVMNASVEYKDIDSDIAPTDVQTTDSNCNPSDNDHENSEEITKHFDGNADNNVESNCLSSSSKSNGIDDDCKVGREAFVHHSDDSMEVELSESDKNKISSENIRLKLNSTIKEKGLNDKVSKIVESSRSYVDETNLVMDLDEEGESELVIDETHTEEELETNKETYNVENIDETVKDDTVRNEENTSENIAESNVLDTGVVVSDGIKKQKQPSLNSTTATENIGLTEVSGNYTNTDISKEAEVSKDDATETDGKKVFPQSMKIVESSSEKSKTVPVSLVDSLLKTGQSHVLYYHDGDDYKPVRIFIDNSEQSSLVLKQMMQSAQFSTINSDESSTSTSNLGFSDLSLNLPIPTNISKTVTKESIVNADHSISRKGSPHPVVEQGNIITDTISVNAGLIENTDEQNSSYQDAFVKSLKSKSGTDSRKVSYTPRLNKRKSSPDRKKSDYSLNKSHTDSVKHKKKTLESEPLYSDADSTVQTQVSSSENVSKSIPTMLNMIGKKYSGGQNMPGKSLGLSSIKTLYNEGTLTRVNPDIKSRLSKALQSSQRKTGPDRKDSESFSYGGVVSTFDAKYIPEVISTITATTDTRQQM